MENILRSDRLQSVGKSLSIVVKEIAYSIVYWSDVKTLRDRIEKNPAHYIINDPCLICVVVCSRLLLLWTTHSFSNKKVSGKWINRMREKANVFELPRPTPTNPGLWVLGSLCFLSSVGLKRVLKVSIFTLFARLEQMVTMFWNFQLILSHSFKWNRQFPLLKWPMHQRRLALRYTRRLWWWIRRKCLPRRVPLPHGFKWRLDRKPQLSGKVPATCWLQMDSWRTCRHIDCSPVHGIRHGTHFRYSADFGRWTNWRLFRHFGYFVRQTKSEHTVFHFRFQLHGRSFPFGCHSREKWL